MAEEKNDDHNHKQDKSSQELENFQNLLQQVLSAPKEKVDEKRAEYERQKERKRQAG